MIGALRASGLNLLAGNWKLIGAKGIAMIVKNLVFVLGAGAHVPYGYPTGKTLKGRIVDSLKQSLRNSEQTLLHARGAMENLHEHLQPGIVEGFVQRLADSGQGSIDAFIHAHRRSPSYAYIGKIAIAKVLLEYEANDAPVKGDEDWMAYLFQEMLDGAHSVDDFKRNRVSFITFNYDTFLERALCRMIAGSLCEDLSEARQVLDGIPIVHMYGQLGSPFERRDVRDRRWTKDWQGIRTIYEVTAAEDPAVTKAKRLLKEADTVCLLGFGYHAENIALLDLPSMVHGPTRAANLYSSAYEITQPEWIRYTKGFPPNFIHRSPIDRGALFALRHLPVF